MIAIPGVPPFFLWAGFILFIIALLALDLNVFHRKDSIITMRQGLMWAAFWITLAMLFNVWVYYQFGSTAALQFFTGFLIEKSLSVDNLFVFLFIFSAFSIPAIYQHRVLFWGIIGAIALRGLFIGLGSALVVRFTWLFFVFGIVLLIAAYRMAFGRERPFDPYKSPVVKLLHRIFPVAHKPDGNKFFTREFGEPAITILFVTLIVIEVSDVIFAFDSIPAIFAITTDPFIVFSSNIFAILGLRSLYFVLAGMHEMFEYLKHGLSVILSFIAVKLILKSFAVEIPLILSLIFIVMVLLLSIAASLAYRPKKRAV